MNGTARWLQSNGITLPGADEIAQGAIACGLIFVALLGGWLVGRLLGPRLTALWHRYAGAQREELGDRLSTVLRHAVAALLLALLANGWVWSTLAAILIGLAMAATVSLCVRAILRGLQMPRWATWLVAAALFLLVFSNTIRNATSNFNLLAVLDSIGFSVGTRHVSLLSAIVIAIGGIVLFALVRLANRVIAHSIARAQSFDPTQKLLVQKLAGIAVVIVAFFIVIDLLRIDLTTFAFFSGALGLAVGFGMQKTVGNLIAGIILLMDRSIKPGDVIVVGDSFGWVNKIGVRAVSVLTRDGKEHLIPNENLMTQEVENWSYSDRKVRVRIPVGVSYSADLEQAQQLMLRAVVESPRVLKTPKPAVQLSAFADNAVMHEIRLWISDPEDGVGSVRSDVLKRIWQLFKEYEIGLPFPQRDVHIRSLPPTPPPSRDT